MNDSGAFDSLRPSDRGHNLLTGDGVEIAASAQIGANVVIHDNVEIGPGALIKHGAVIGVPPSYDDGTSAERIAAARTVIGANATICLYALVFEGAEIGESALVGDNAIVREGAVMHEHSVLGRLAGLGQKAQLGARARVQTMSGITPYSIVEEDVFVSGYVVTTTGNSMTREDRGARQVTRLRRGCRVGAGAVLTPGVEIGAEAFVAAGTVVTKDVEPRAKVRGVPCEVYGRVSDAELLENWR